MTQAGVNIFKLSWVKKPPLSKKIAAGTIEKSRFLLKTRALSVLA